MHPLKPLMKKLILIYGLALAVVIVYFILRSFFPQEKAMELKHFNTGTQAVEGVQTDKKEQAHKETQPQQRFMLLP